METTPSRTAVIALLDEHERAITHLVNMMQTWDARMLDRVVPGDKSSTYGQVLRHTVSAAYFGYFVWTQRVLGWDVLPPPIADREQIKAARSLEALQALLHESTPYARRALVNLTNDHLDDTTQYLSNWNQPHTIEQMLEHAVVHVWRHIRQIERAEAARTSVS